MKILDFFPNYLRKNNAYEKNSTKKKDTTPVKKHTKIEGAIKTADEVQSAVAETIKRVKSQGKAKKGTDKRTARGRARKKNLSAKV